MTGVIIAGGAGVRLRPLTYIRPKPMMPVANKPLLQYQVELLRKHGATDIVFCVSGDIDPIKEHFGSGEDFGIGITYSVEDEPLGTAGAVRYSEPYWRHDTAIVMNGDGLIDYNLSDMVRFHVENHAEATIGLIKVPRPTPCGIVTADSDGKLISFDEPDLATKRTAAPDPSQPGNTATVNSGAYVVSRSAIRRIAYGAKCSIEKEFFPSLIASGAGIYGFPLTGYWKDIGNPRAYLQAHYDLLAGKIDAELPGTRTDGGWWTDGEVSIEPTAEIGPGAHIRQGSIFGAGVKVKGFTTIGPGCVIGEGSVIDGCLLLENVTVGAGCSLRKCILDREARLGDHVRLADNSVVGANSAIYGPHQDGRLP